MGLQFSFKSREAKDRYIDANIKNIISELSIEIKNFGMEIVLRKLLLSLMSVQLAQNIGVDHHAATEELYYYMKKNEDTSIIILEFIDKIIKINNGNYSWVKVILSQKSIKVPDYILDRIRFTGQVFDNQNIINSPYSLNLWIIQSYVNQYSTWTTIYDM